MSVRRAATPTHRDWSVTPEKIDEAVRRLVEVAQPSRIILFGSAARGELHEHSDVDLLVVLPEEPESVREVGKRLDQAVTGIRMSKDILVVSEDRLAELGDRPSLVYREALREGRVIYEAPPMSPRRKRAKKLTPSDAGLPHTWLAHARSDLASARILRADPDVLPEQAGFHAQQAVEKAVKAALLARNVEFPYTHDLEDLVNEVTSRGMAVPIEAPEAEALTRFAVEMRYPNPEEITDADIDDAIRIADAVLAWATPLVPTPRKAT
jgi:HEPN domain-containing protein/predicted nucleotidyltransferase